MNGQTEARQFESSVRDFLSHKWDVPLKTREVTITESFGKKFDLVSEDFQFVGDAKYLKDIPVPAAKFSNIAEYVWLLEKVKAQHKFMVFGKDKRIATRWLEKHRSLFHGIKFYFFDGHELLELN